MRLRWSSLLWEGGMEVAWSAADGWVVYTELMRGLSGMSRKAIAR